MTTAFHFSSSTPDEQLSSDIQKINALGEEALGQFVDVLLLQLTEGSDLAAGVSAFAEQQGISENRLKNTVKALLYFFRESIKANSSPKQLAEDLLNFGIAKEKIVVVARRWKDAFLLLSRSVIDQTLEINEVLDMEWKFGVIAANKELSSVGSSFLQLRLDLDKGNEKKETVHMELTLPQFYQFLSEMEKAKLHMEYFG